MLLGEEGVIKRFSPGLLTSRGRDLSDDTSHHLTLACRARAWPWGRSLLLAKGRRVTTGGAMRPLHHS